MGALAVFGITNDGLNLAVNLLLLASSCSTWRSIYWTYADAKRRVDDPMLVGCATAASFFPFIGTIVYMIVRPPEFIEDRARARARDRGRRGAAGGHGPPRLPVLRLRHREELPPLPELPAAAEGAVRDVRQAARPALEDLPLLRGRDRPGRAPPPPRRDARSNSSSQPFPRSRSERTPHVDRTLILVKPDAFARNLTGEIIARFERKGLRIVALKHMQMDSDLASAALRRARGQAVLRRARRLHHERRRSSRWCSKATRRSRPPAR